MKAVLCALLILASSLVFAAPHSVALSWAASSDAAGNPTLTYSVYRAAGSCAPGITFNKIASNLNVLTYSDAGIAPGTYCYHVTAVLAGAESVPSNEVTAVILPAAPTALTATVN